MLKSSNHASFGRLRHHKRSASSEDLEKSNSSEEVLSSQSLIQISSRMGSRSETHNGGDADIVEVVVTPSLKTRLSNVAPLTSERCIYRVPRTLRKVKPEAYTPQLVSIGPFHRGSPRLKPMEVHKLRYLQDFLKRDPEKTIEFYIKNLKGLEVRARQHYDEHIRLTSDIFVEMLLIDGCFIIEFMLRYSGVVEPRDETDFLWTAESMVSTLKNDMLLLENQLPFFILKCLFDLFNKGPDGQLYEESFLDLTTDYFLFNDLRKGQDDFLKKDPNYKVKHFVDLIRQSYVPSAERMLPNPKFKFIPSATELHEAGVKFEKSSQKCEAGVVLGAELHEAQLAELQPLLHEAELAELHEAQLAKLHESGVAQLAELHEAGVVFGAELHEAGVKFEKSSQKCFLDVSFTNGVLSIPTLSIGDQTESLFRNLMALDFFHKSKDNYVTDYIILMDKLTNTSQDVALLRNSGIIDNLLGDDEEVSRVFNKLCTGVYFDSATFYYACLFEKVNAYYEKPWHVWRAKLQRDYFSTPWLILSFLAAFIILICTIAQTVFSVVFR